MDCPWTVYGLSMNCLWTVYGLSKDTWASVTYSLSTEEEAKRSSGGGIPRFCNYGMGGTTGITHTLWYVPSVTESFGMYHLCNFL